MFYSRRSSETHDHLHGHTMVSISSLRCLQNPSVLRKPLDLYGARSAIKRPLYRRCPSAGRIAIRRRAETSLPPPFEPSSSQSRSLTTGALLLRTKFAATASLEQLLTHPAAARISVLPRTPKTVLPTPYIRWMTTSSSTRTVTRYHKYHRSGQKSTRRSPPLSGIRRWSHSRQGPVPLRIRGSTHLRLMS